MFQFYLLHVTKGLDFFFFFTLEVLNDHQCDLVSSPPSVSCVQTFSVFIKSLSCLLMPPWCHDSAAFVLWPVGSWSHQWLFETTAERVFLTLTYIREDKLSKTIKPVVLKWLVKHSNWSVGCEFVPGKKRHVLYGVWEPKWTKNNLFHELLPHLQVNLCSLNLTLVVFFWNNKAGIPVIIMYARISYQDLSVIIFICFSS